LIEIGCGVGEAEELEVGWYEPAGVTMWIPTTTGPIRSREWIDKPRI
jgi:hypothetical protein